MWFPSTSPLLSPFSKSFLPSAHGNKDKYSIGSDKYEYISKERQGLLLQQSHRLVTPNSRRGKRPTRLNWDPRKPVEELDSDDDKSDKTGSFNGLEWLTGKLQARPATVNILRHSAAVCAAAIRPSPIDQHAWRCTTRAASRGAVNIRHGCELHFPLDGTRGTALKVLQTKAGKEASPVLHESCEHLLGLLSPQISDAVQSRAAATLQSVLQYADVREALKDRLAEKGREIPSHLPLDAQSHRPAAALVSLLWRLSCRLSPSLATSHVISTSSHGDGQRPVGSVDVRTARAAVHVASCIRTLAMTTDIAIELVRAGLTPVVAEGIRATSVWRTGAAGAIEELERKRFIVACAGCLESILLLGGPFADEVIDCGAAADLISTAQHDSHHRAGLNDLMCQTAAWACIPALCRSHLGRETFINLDGLSAIVSAMTLIGESSTRGQDSVKKSAKGDKDENVQARKHKHNYVTSTPKYISSKYIKNALIVNKDDGNEIQSRASKSSKNSSVSIGSTGGVGDTCLILQERAVETLLILCNCPKSLPQLKLSVFFHPLVKTLEHGTLDARIHAANALEALSRPDNNSLISDADKGKFASSPVGALASPRSPRSQGSPRVMCDDPKHDHPQLCEEQGKLLILPVIKMFEENAWQVRCLAARISGLLCKWDEHRQELGEKHNIVVDLIYMLREKPPALLSDPLYALSELCKDPLFVERGVEEGMVEPLVRILPGGDAGAADTTRRRRRALMLLKYAAIVWPIEVKHARAEMAVCEHVVGMTEEDEYELEQFIERRRASDYLPVSELNLQHFKPEEMEKFKAAFKPFDKHCLDALQPEDVRRFCAAVGKKVPHSLKGGDIVGPTSFNEILDELRQSSANNTTAFGSLTDNIRRTLASPRARKLEEDTMNLFSSFAITSPRSRGDDVKSEPKTPMSVTSAVTPVGSPLEEIPLRTGVALLTQIDSPNSVVSVASASEHMSGTSVSPADVRSRKTARSRSTKSSTHHVGSGNGSHDSITTKGGKPKTSARVARDTSVGRVGSDGLERIPSAILFAPPSSPPTSIEKVAGHRAGAQSSPDLHDSMPRVRGRNRSDKHTHNRAASWNNWWDPLKSDVHIDNNGSSAGVMNADVGSTLPPLSPTQPPKELFIHRCD